MQLEGSARGCPLSELIGQLAEHSVTGVLEIEAPGASGRIFCRAGQVYHAEAGGETAFDALRRLIQTEDAPFRIALGAYHSEETLRADTPSLIGHVRCQEALYERMRRHIPTLESILVLVAPNGDAVVRLDATLWPALALIDGQRSVAAIAAELGHEPFEVGLLLGQLLARGLATLTSQPHATQSAAEPARDRTSGESIASSGDAPSIGFFERLLTSRAEEQPKPTQRAGESGCPTCSSREQHSWRA